MKPPKKPISPLTPGWNTSHGEPRGDQHLNQDRLRALEEARIAHLPNYIDHLEKRLISLDKQKEKALRLLAEARKEYQGL